jgi:UDP-N-acetylmuramate dehydrogenase
MAAVPPAPHVDVSLRALNTFGVEARARLLIELEDVADVAPALAIVREAGGGPLILGAGSNVLFTSDAVERPVLRVRLLGRQRAASPDDAVVGAAAGEDWDAFVRWTLSVGLFGLENLSLIPGTVGAAPIQNIGAYGVEMSERFESLDAVHVDSGERRRFGRADCGFRYRDSTFRHGDGRRWLIVAVRFRLLRTPSLQLDYGEIREQLAADRVTAATPRDVADAVSAIRRRRLPDPGTIGNAGSFFRNPVVDAATAAALQADEPELRCWPAEGGVKLSAAWMIERCGWKGFRAGDAGVHRHHALVLVNHGGATGAEILALADRIRDSVAQRFGIRLDPEPLLV